MKILLVSCAYPPHNRGGVAKLLTNLSVELIRRKHHVYVFSLIDDLKRKKYATEDVNINGHQTRFINIPLSSLTDLFGRYRINDYYNPDINLHFRSYLDEIQPDIIHFHAMQGLGANLITEAHKEGYPTILTMHDVWWFCPNLFKTDLNLKPCDQTKINIHNCMICLKNLNEMSGIRNLNIESFISDRYIYLKNVLKTDVDRILTNSFTLKEQVQHNITREIQVNENGIIKISKLIDKPIDPHKIIFGFVGGTSELKGYNTLIDAFMNIKSSNWELHIYGIEKIGSAILYKEFIKNIKNKSFWSNFLRFLSSKKKGFFPHTNIKYFPSYSDEEKYKTLNALDVIIIPSIIRESFSLIAREGMILKKPIICSDCGGPEEIVKNNVNGLIFKTNNAEDLKSKICKILSNSSLINRFKDNIDTQRIKSIEDQINDLENIYKLHVSLPKKKQ